MTLLFLAEFLLQQWLKYSGPSKNVVDWEAGSYGIQHAHITELAINILEGEAKR